MKTSISIGALVTYVLVIGVELAAAQTGGSLRGYVKDEQGTLLPGVTVTATSPDVIKPAVGTTDAEGAYRLVGLPPTTYTITAKLSGFATVTREGIVLPANANFAVDITLKVAGVTETLTVSGDSPMLEVSKPGNVLNIDGEFQKSLPLASRKNWTDFLELTPGVHLRPFDDGSGRMVYFGHATEHFAHVVQLEGMQAGNYNDFQLTYVQMGTDMIKDTQVKTGGSDAATPMGTGLAINVITKSGGNQFKGTAGYAFQPLSWNANNTHHRTEFPLPSQIPITACPNKTCVSTGGSPVQADIKQFDGGFGGPIQRDRLWFFGAFRVSRVATGISRVQKNIDDIQAYYPNATIFDQKIEGYQPYVKVTGRIGQNHELSGFFQRDRTTGQNNWEYYFDQINSYGNGGNVYNAKLSSAWGQRFTTAFSLGYNNKHGSDNDTYSVFGSDLKGPNIEIYEGTTISGGLITGNNRILEGGNVDTLGFVPASLWLIRGDATYFKSGWGGSHELQTGFFIEPQNIYDQLTVYANDGFYQEFRTPVDVNNPSLGTRPFRRYYASPAEVQTRKARDSNYAVYVQDNWRPGSRLTANLGMRFDYVKRVDKIQNITRQQSWTIQPRIGATYLLTEDARNVLRASWVRLGEQVMGRDGVTIFGADDTVNIRIEYDNDLDGVWGEPGEVVLQPRATSAIASQQIAGDLHQPYLDELIVGYRKQLRWQIGIDAAYINREYKEMWANVDINGFWPSRPGEPFGGFGRVDPNQGIILQQTNNTWSTLKYQAIEITMTKNMSHGFQFMAGLNRQWHKMDGTWNPTDRAGYLQPNHFANDKNLYMARGNNDGDSLPNTGNALSYGPTWMKYRMNFGGVWRAPYDFNVAGNVTVQAGPWSGAILYQLPANHPEILAYGPASFPLANGTTAANPLSTRNRYVFSSRGEGQFQAPAIVTVGLKVGKVLRYDRYQFEISGNILNLLNAGDYTQFNYNSAYQSWSSNFLLMRNQQPARAFQLNLTGRF
ncbi:MAG TPA: TonB-dependent receptor [Vicinamibacterales bacterium]|nr:TonB-dependent receptor [Vicinamibacterales bacterium]